MVIDREYNKLITIGADYIHTKQMTRDAVLDYLSTFYPNLSFQKVVDDMNAALKRSENPEIGRYENMIRSNSQRVVTEIRNNKPRYDENFSQYADRMSQNSRAALWSCAHLVFQNFSENASSVMAMIALRDIANSED